MKYTKSELVKMSENADMIEAYKYTDSTKRVHTDCVRYIGEGMFDLSELDCLNYDEDGNADVDVYMMDEEEYNNTICANSCECFTLESDAKIMVVIDRCA